jgi:hypothetical protein
LQGSFVVTVIVARAWQTRRMNRPPRTNRLVAASSGVFRDAKTGRPLQAVGYHDTKTFITMLEMKGSSTGVVFELD